MAHLSGIIELRPIPTWCYVEGDFVYESADLYKRLSDLRQKFCSRDVDFFAPKFYKWAVEKEIIDQEGNLINMQKCTEIMSEMLKMGK